MAGRQDHCIATTLAFGLLGAGLIFFGRRTSPGLIANVATTAGYGLVTKAVSTAVVAALDATAGV